MLILTVLTSYVVGSLTCFKYQANGKDEFHMVDKSKCWVGDMNAALNDGQTLMKYCNPDPGYVSQ